MNNEHATIPYTITLPPATIQRAKLDNIALIPASLLPFKGKYQPLANTLPTGSALCVLGPQRQQQIMAMVTQFFRDHGHQVITLPLQKITRK